MDLFPNDPDDVIPPPWNPDAKKYAAYKAREVELAREEQAWLRSTNAPLSSWTMGLFSFDTWLVAL
jgi:hypothetical protein